MRAEAGGIPLTEIEAWTRLNGWREPEMIGRLVRIVRALDRVVLEHRARIVGSPQGSVPEPEVVLH